MSRRIPFTALAVAVLLPLAAACDDQGPDVGQAQVFMSRTGSASAELAEAALESAALAAIALSSVDSINVTITSVEALPAGSDSASFVTLQLVGEAGAGRRINLLALPRAGQDSIMLARGSMAAGTYGHVRLRYDPNTATITLKESVTVGQRVIAAGRTALRIPSGEQTGLKIPTATFTIPAESTAGVNLVFDAATSVGSIQATGAAGGTLQLSPVLTARTGGS